MIVFYKILNGLTPKYLSDIILVSNDSWQNTRAQLKLELTQFYTRTKSLSNTFFPFCIKEWNKLDAKIRNLPSISRFKKSLLIYFRTDENSIFDVHNPIDIKLLNRVRLNFKININFTIISGILLIQSAFEMPKLKLLVTISCIALCFPNKERNFLKPSVILTILY